MNPSLQLLLKARIYSLTARVIPIQYVDVVLMKTKQSFSEPKYNGQCCAALRVIDNVPRSGEEKITCVLTAVEQRDMSLYLLPIVKNNLYILGY